MGITFNNDHTVHVDTGEMIRKFYTTCTYITSCQTTLLAILLSYCRPIVSLALHQSNETYLAVCWKNCFRQRIVAH